MKQGIDTFVESDGGGLRRFVVLVLAKKCGEENIG